LEEALQGTIKSCVSCSMKFPGLFWQGLLAGATKWEVQVLLCRPRFFRLVACSGGRLRGKHLRPRLAVGSVQHCRRREVEELAHIPRGILPVGVARGERGDSKLFLNERENCRVV